MKMNERIASFLKGSLMSILPENIDFISRKLSIGTYQSHIFNNCLRNQQSVERIVMVRRQIFEIYGMWK